MFKELFTEKTNLKSLIPTVKKAHKEIKDVILQKVSGGEYLEVTYKNSEHREETIKTLKKILPDVVYDFDYDGTALLISVRD